MSLDICRETLQRTKRCTERFRCLNDGKYPLCSVDRLIEGDGILINTLNHNDCPYATRFGCDYICNCPTRREIYTRYKK